MSSAVKAKPIQLIAAISASTLCLFNHAHHLCDTYFHFIYYYLILCLTYTSSTSN